MELAFKGWWAGSWERHQQQAPLLTICWLYKAIHPLHWPELADSAEGWRVDEVVLDGQDEFSSGIDSTDLVRGRVSDKKRSLVSDTVFLRFALHLVDLNFFTLAVLFVHGLRSFTSTDISWAWHMVTDDSTAAVVNCGLSVSTGQTLYAQSCFDSSRQTSDMEA